MNLLSPDAQFASAGGKWKERDEGQIKFSKRSLDGKTRSLCKNSSVII